MKNCPKNLPLTCESCEDEAECTFITLVDALSAGRTRAVSRALAALADLGWVVTYIGGSSPTMRQRDDAVFWFTTLDLVAAHGKIMEVAKVQRKLAKLGWVVTRIAPFLTGESFDRE